MKAEQTEELTSQNDHSYEWGEAIPVSLTPFPNSRLTLATVDFQAF
jgi:hypothetical protein